jgi:hypothetical protein
MSYTKLYSWSGPLIKRNLRYNIKLPDPEIVMMYK